MKNNKIWYIGYLIGICGLILMFTIKFNETIEIVFAFVFGGCISISHVKILHHKMMEKDHHYDGINIDDSNGNNRCCMYFGKRVFTSSSFNDFRYRNTINYVFYQ